LEKIIKARKSTWSFSPEIPKENDISKILESAFYDPYDGTTGIPFNEIRKIYIYSGKIRQV